jgi:hypothetical protein
MPSTGGSSKPCIMCVLRRARRVKGRLKVDIMRILTGSLEFPWYHENPVKIRIHFIDFKLIAIFLELELFHSFYLEFSPILSFLRYF